MRFSITTAVAALPALSMAQENPFEQYQAQFQTFLGNMGAYIPSPGRHDPVAAHQAKVGSLKLHTLTLDNWRETLLEPVTEYTTEPEEWWVLTTGGNRTCYGHCGQLEKAFNETAAKFAVIPNSPHMGMLSCEDQPVLCNSWSASPGAVWVFDMLPNLDAINIYKRRFNMTTVTSNDIVALRDDKEKLTLVDGWFHPFHGKAAELGIAVPFGYFTWAFSMIPNWLFMIVVSFASRTMMSRRMAPPANGNRQ